MTTSDFNVGDQVLFGRGQGEKTLGTVVKVNRAKLKVRQDEARGQRRDYAVGSVWTVPPSLCQRVGKGGEVTTLHLKVGQTVEFQGFSWRARGEGSVVGVVTQVGATAYEVYAESGAQQVAPDKLSQVACRSEALIMRELSGVYASLSPENLTCDGELSRTQVARKSAVLRRALRALQSEAGRVISEGEVYQAAG